MVNKFESLQSIIPPASKTIILNTSVIKFQSNLKRSNFRSQPESGISVINHSWNSKENTYLVFSYFLF